MLGHQTFEIANDLFIKYYFFVAICRLYYMMPSFATQMPVMNYETRCTAPSVLGRMLAVPVWLFVLLTRMNTHLNVIPLLLHLG